jgi:hypothetical protein
VRKTETDKESMKGERGRKTDNAWKQRKVINKITRKDEARFQVLMAKSMSMTVLRRCAL